MLRSDLLILGACLLAVGAPVAGQAQPPESELGADANGPDDEAAERPAEGEDSEVADAPADEPAPDAADEPAPSGEGEALAASTPCGRKRPGRVAGGGALVNRVDGRSARPAPEKPC